MRLGHPTDRGRGRVAARPHRDRTTGPLTGSSHVAHHQPLVALDDRHPGVCGGLVVPLEQALRSPYPASDRRHQRGVHQQVQSDASRRAGRRERVAGPHRVCVGAFPRLDGHLDMAGGVGDLGQQPEIVERKPGVLVGPHEQAVGPWPVTGGGRLAALLHQFRSGHVVHRSPICRHAGPRAAVTPRATRVTVFLTPRG